MRILSFLAVVAGALALAGCGSSKSNEKSLEEAPKIVVAPAVFKAKFDTSRGDFTLEIHRDWAPKGVDRFYDLLQKKFFDDARFFRVVSGFVVQFGINKDPKVSAEWRQANLEDDPVKESNTRGSIVYATAGKNTRTTQLFINLSDNLMLDTQGFAPFGKVIDGMSVVDHLYADYGDMAPQGRGPDPMQIEYQGNAYLLSNFPRLDYVKTVVVTP